MIKKALTVIANLNKSRVATFKRIEDSLRFGIPESLDSGFQSLTGFWISDFKAQDSEFHKQNSRIPEYELPYIG